MENLPLLIIFCYLLGTAGYTAYLFFQKDRLQSVASGFLLAGLAIHSIHVINGFVKIGTIPVHNLNQTLSIAAWAVIVVFFWIQYRFHLKIIGVYAAPLAAFIMVGASSLPRQPAQNEILLKSIWLQLHIIGVFIGEAAFALACGLGILYLIQENAIKAKTRGFFFKRLPSLDLLDIAGQACIMAGFMMITIGLITGFIYAKSVWGKFWSWDPKEVWSGITWLIYAALIHQRYTVGWRGRKSAILAIIGFAAVIFTFFGVNFLLKGHHEAFTRF